MDAFWEIVDVDLLWTVAAWAGIVAGAVCIVLICLGVYRWILRRIFSSKYEVQVPRKIAVRRSGTFANQLELGAGP